MIPLSLQSHSLRGIVATAGFLLLTMSTAVAQTSGPSTPEVQGYTPHDTDGLVNMFTGDFTYTIPLLDVGGYPVSLSYSSGIGTHDEASFVGLGWNLSPGVINRQVRALPDDFKGESITKVFNVKDDETLGITTGFSMEYTGFDTDIITGGGGFSLGFSHNTYAGWDAEVGFSNSIKAGGSVGNSKLSGSLSHRFGASAREGAYQSAGLGLNYSMSNATSSTQFGSTVGFSTSSREGLQQVTFGASFSRKWQQKYYAGESKGSRSHDMTFPLSFANPTYTPLSDIPMSAVSGTFNAKLGAELTGFAIGGDIQFYFALQKLAHNRDTLPSYGYMYSQFAGDGKVLMDVNREKDGPFIKENPNLPIPNFAYDLYSVSGEGFSGSFRPFRGDVGMLFDPATTAKSLGVAAGGEIAIGNLTHGGVDIKINDTSTGTKKWTDGNGLASVFKFTDQQSGNPLYESVYFKNVGELTAMNNESLFHTLGGFEPVAVPVDGNGTCTNTLVNEQTGFSESHLSGDNLRTNRETRNTLFSWLTAQEASYMGLEKTIRDYGLERLDLPPFNLSYMDIDRMDDHRKPHHISEITITREDGTRYVYGIAAYNVVTKEVSFNISGASSTDTTTLVRYNPGVDNSPANRRGRNHYYQSVETPPYAYAYLLTAIVSSDYVDLTGDGPSPDDFGTYTRFNYKRHHTNFKWRAPFQQNMAYYNPGNFTDEADDIASYTYGEKEIWYLTSVETKNYVAEFFLSDREDGVGVAGENGGPDLTQRLKKLDRIMLFSQADRIQRVDAEPVKVVYFDYNYQLSPGIPSSAIDSGKLTLSKVAVSFGNSDKERFSPHTFRYDNNPSYGEKLTDRWGNYKQETSSSNKRFPYVDQDTTLTNDYASAWHLSNIKLPSGGNLNIEYEADDYGFVQDRSAMEMRKIVGFHNSSSGPSSGNRLYNSSSVNQYVFFELKRPISSSDPQAEEKLSAYVDGIKELYFNCMVDIWGNVNVGTINDAKDTEEEVSGFIPVDLNEFGTDFGLYSDRVAWIKLPKISRGDTDVADPFGVHPIAKATWQKLRKSIPRFAFPVADPTDANPLAFLELMGAAMENLISSTTDLYSVMWVNRRADAIDLSRSFLRLNSPDGKKLGGGSRVKAITITDEWGNMTGDPSQNFQYGQRYIYTTADDSNGTSREISSGVASYEPMVGGDENPFALPLRYRVEKTMALDLNLHILEPLGESFFPAPQVGYRKVKVFNITPPNVTRTATGYVQHEFYTAKDFPTIAKQTKMMKAFREIPAPPFYSEKTATVSQGFYVELNDMHGKEKAMKVFQETDYHNPITGVEYTYKTDPSNDKRLSNTVSVINEKTGLEEQRLVGVEYDFITDAREIYSETFGPGAQLNIDVFFVSIVPFPIPMVYPEMSYALSRYRGIVTTKVVQRSGIIDEVVVYDMGSRIATQHVAYDGTTGRTVVSRLEDEFHDPYYETNIPVHWIYDRMGFAYKNHDLAFENVTVSGGVISIAGAETLFVRADEVMMERLDEPDEVQFLGGIIMPNPVYIPKPPFRAWVHRVTGSSIALIDKSGAPVTNGEYNIRVIRSGRRNMQTMSAGKVLTKDTPIAASGFSFVDVLDASAATFSDQWQTYDGLEVTEPTTACTCAPALGGESGSYPVIAELINFLQTRTSGGGLYEDYAVLPHFLYGVLGSAPKTYHAEINGSRLDIIIMSQDSLRQQCRITLRTEDGSPFPKYVYNLTASDQPLIDFSTYTCNDVNAFRWVAHNQIVGAVPIIISTNCVNLLECDEVTTEEAHVDCGVGAGKRINPYVNGVLGNWRPQSAYKYVTRRVATGNSYEQGAFENFHNFLQPLHFSLSPTVDTRQWQRADLTTIIDPFHKELEARDPLQRHSAALVGYGYNLPVATIANARYHQAAFDGFEDYSFKNQISSPLEKCSLPSHWNFNKYNDKVTDSDFHTGKYSLELKGGEKASVSRKIEPMCDPLTRTVPASNTYSLQACDLVKTFSPAAGKYIISLWVKEKSSTASLATTYEHVRVDVRFQTSAGTTTQSFSPSGPIIDGWQKIEGEFDLPAATIIIVDLVNASPTTTRLYYFDDIRIQPFNSGMEAYIYDPVTLRLTAVLDTNNFATFYEYDQEGKLTRTKRETERGVMTMQEVRSSKPKM